MAEQRRCIRMPTVATTYGWLPSGSTVEVDLDQLTACSASRLSLRALAEAAQKAYDAPPMARQRHPHDSK
eukprot:91416-Chlamydomonas_euryale.AAC.1